MNLTNGLVLHYTFDGPDMTTATATDKSGNGNHGTLVNGPKPAIGKVGQGLFFSDDGLQAINAGSQLSLDNLSTKTASTWIKPSSDNLDFPYVLNKGFGSSRGWNLVMSSSGRLRLEVVFSGTDGSWDGPYLKTDSWHHIVVVYDDTNASNIPIFYINGIATTTTTNAQPTGSYQSESVDNLFIGNNWSVCCGFDGILDDVRIYNRILNEKEIQALYNLGAGSKISTTLDTPTNLQTGLVGYWTFDGPDMTTATATDVSGSGNHGTLVNGPKPAIGKVGQGLQFDGVNDYVDAGTSVTLAPAQLTLSGWINPEVFPIGDSYDEPIRKAGSYGLSFRGSGVSGLQNTLQFILDTTISDYSVYVPNTYTPLNTWTHVLMTANGNKFRVYINGTQYGSDENYSGDIDNVPANHLFIGTYGTTVRSSARDFKGKLDDIRIYNRALSADEVRQLYELGVGSKIEICKESSVQDADGNAYNTIAIGSQCWLDRNMNVGTRINASTAQTNNGTIEKYCYNDTDSNCTTNNPNRPDGGLYQWNEAMQYSTQEGARGICPVGFHIPTDAEWHTLEKFLKDSGQPCDGSRYGQSCSPTGAKLKPNGLSRFELNLSGSYIGIWLARSAYGYMWSSSMQSTNAWVRYFASFNGVYRDTYPVNDSRAYSVRCLQDY